MSERQSEPGRDVERPNLERCYGQIGISAVAAAARYKEPKKAPVAQKIPSRFEEDTVA